ncbi:aspartate/glutamate racemase family protein [Labrys sp. ZIDIC5]|uniref:aspartate/glutamate racemase family protein n=1 Tax=Labrys sedimenti TaxID=3106036 RepID=UPI002ACAB7E8|nr:amino acid racemase [Labrys sp. ZIDIC5]MDZ5454212.1 amino acid racemase [Labrys sp. ZIDIC5]
MTGRLLRPRLGVVGGLGPLATADFYRKTIDAVPAETDADHISMAILSVPQIPDRSGAIREGNDKPLPWLIEAIDMLNSLDVEIIAIACNTAHHWYDALAAASRAEIVHIADAAIDELHRRSKASRVAVMATRGTLRSGFYQKRLQEAGFDCCNPTEPAFQHAVDDAILQVKLGDLKRAKRACAAAFEYCRKDGLEAVILACTELPIAAEDVAPEGTLVVDASRALALTCVRRLRNPDRMRNTA